MTTRTPIILISGNAQNLADALTAYIRTATVEAEYGDILVEGTVATLAHHGPRSGNPCPCLHTEAVEVEVIGFSHFDHDAVGGALALMGIKPEGESFWQLAAFIDINGPHKISQSGASEEDVARMYAYFAWSQTCRVFPPRDGSVLDITDKVLKAGEALTKILADDPEMLEAGAKFRKAETELNANSLVERVGDVLVRCAPSFCNHLYADTDGNPARAVVAFNTAQGSVTMSLAETTPGVSCVEILQSVFTDKDDEGRFKAGGHAGIGGSPRDRRATLDELTACRDAMVAALSQ